MKYHVNENCMGCHLCVEICPDVYSMTESGSARAIGEDVPREHLSAANLALDSCPAFAIEEMA